MRFAPNYLYTILIYILLHTLTALSVLFSLLFSYFGYRKGVNFVLRVWAKGSFLIIGKRLRIEGLGNIEKGKKYILMANHSSMFDIMGIMSVCPRVAWFGRAYLIKIPVFGKLLKTINYVPMQTTDLRNTKKMVNQMIENTQDHTVAIFPEGTRTLSGELSRFRKGFLHVLKASKLDILPVSLVGFYEFKPKNRFYFKYFTKLSVKVHEPIKYEQLENLEDNEIIEMVQSKIASALPFYLNNTYGAVAK